MAEYLSVYLGQVNRRSAATEVALVTNGVLTVRDIETYEPDKEKKIVNYKNMIDHIDGLRVKYAINRSPAMTTMPVIIGECHIGQPLIDYVWKYVKEKLCEPVVIVSITNDPKLEGNGDHLYVTLKDLISAFITFNQFDKFNIKSDIQTNIEEFLKELPDFYKGANRIPGEPSELFDYCFKDKYANIMCIAIVCWYTLNKEKGTGPV